MSEPLVKVRVDGSCGTLIMNRPDCRNALSRQLLTEIGQALQDLYQERKVRAVILTGAGSAFCAGADLGEILAASRRDAPERQWQEDALQYRDLVQQMLQYPKPIVAAVGGAALGAGAGLLLAADLVVAARSATFGVPAPRRGLVAGMVAPLLVFRVGGSHAANLLLTSRTIDSDTAFRMGIFHELVADDLVWARACQLGQECAAASHEALGLTKRLLNETIGEQLSTLLTTGAAITATSKTTEAAREGIQAFLERRPPQWP